MDNMKSGYFLFALLTVFGLGCAEVFAPTSPTNCPIPDAGMTNTFASCTSQTINIPTSGIITSLRVGFQFIHTYNSDILVALLPPGKHKFDKD